jgi:predicted HicB family RNase H-like nuclease
MKKKKNKEKVAISLDITEEEFLLIARVAHREGMSLNDWVNLALREVLDGDLEYESHSTG